MATTTIKGIKITYNKDTLKVGHMSDWTKCWTFAREGILDSNYYNHLHGHVDFFIPRKGHVDY